MGWQLDLLLTSPYQNWKSEASVIILSNGWENTTVNLQRYILYNYLSRTDYKGFHRCKIWKYLLPTDPHYKKKIWSLKKRTWGRMKRIPEGRLEKQDGMTAQGMWKQEFCRGGDFGSPRKAQEPSSQPVVRQKLRSEGTMGQDGVFQGMKRNWQKMSPTPVIPYDSVIWLLNQHYY